MQWFKIFSKTQRERNRGSGSNPPKRSSLFGPFRFWEIVTFVTFVAIISALCFLGQKDIPVHLVAGQLATERIIAEYPFEYRSQVLADRRIAEVRLQEPPVFRRSLEGLHRFEAFLRDLTNRFAQDEIDQEDSLGVVGKPSREAIEDALAELTTRYNFPVDSEYVHLLVEGTTPRERADLLAKTLERLREIHAIGIFADAPVTDRDDHHVVQIIGETGAAGRPEPLSTRDALIRLRVAVTATAIDETTARALFGIFRNGIEPNLLFSQTATESAIQRAVNRVDAPLVRFRAGDILMERGTTLTSLDVERMIAYAVASPSLVSEATGLLDAAFYERAFWTFVTLLVVAVYIKLAVPPHPKRNRAIAIAVIAIVLNLALIRLVQSDALTALVGPGAAAILPFAAPIALGPILVAVLIGPAAAAMSAFIVAVLYGMMHGFGLPLALAAFLSGIVAALLSGNICQRSRIVRSSMFGGVVFALSALFIGLIGAHGPVLIVQQMAAAVLIGLLTGIIAIGVLPFLENLFKVTTEITLLELTDFNHPLLRRMQVDAPGTYHHSLMVSNLSENAAAAIGASPLLCRACSLFHDIGKLVKPEYFVENQRGLNPHDGRSPSMSALIIKAHVKEGVDLARKNKLPRIIIDVIRQHHGKSIIHYFYMAALKKAQADAGPEKASEIARDFDESPYRYDGPKPQFKESAIIFFADSVEAASRTLKKATTVSIEELVDGIIQSRIDDGQLDECPLTFQELRQIRTSFVFTLLNMLHSRIEYPKDSRKSEKDAARSRPRSHAPGPVTAESITHPVPQLTPSSSER